MMMMTSPSAFVNKSSGYEINRFALLAVGFSRQNIEPLPAGRWRRTSTGSEPFPLLISLDATIFILPSVFILIETICPKNCSKSGLKSAKRPFPVDVRRSKTSLLKLPS